MKKSILMTVLAVIIAICSFGLVACTNDSTNNEKPAGLRMKIYDGDSYYTVYDYGDSEVLTDGKLVLSEDANIGRIQTGAFDGNDTIKELVIPSTVKIIDEGAFKGMKSLEKITLPFVGRTVNSDAFLGETGKTEDKTTDFARTFGYLFGQDEFDGGISLTQKVNETTTETYYAPLSLTEIHIEAKDEYSIPMFAFSGNTVIKKVTFNDKVVGIGQSAFEGCTYLKDITAESVTTIYDKAFYGCEDLTSLTAFANVTKIGQSAFENSGVTEVTLKNGVTYGSRAFAGSKVKTINLSADVPYACFYGCQKITAVNVNANVTLGSFSFAELGQALEISKGAYTVNVVDNTWNGFNEKVKIV